MEAEKDITESGWAYSKKGWLQRNTKEDVTGKHKYILEIKSP
jgi:hypothetical protein